MVASLQQTRDSRCGYVQLGECKHFLAQIFQRCSDMVDFRVIYYQKTVVALLISVYFYRGILRIVFLQIQFQLVADGLRMDIGCYAGFPLA